MPYSTLFLTVSSSSKPSQQRAVFARSVTPLRALLAVASTAWLAGCGGYDNQDNCYQCGVGQNLTEVSFGVVSGDFNGDGFADVVALSTDEPQVAPNASNLKTYLSIGPGRFSPPTL